MWASLIHVKRCSSRELRWSHFSSHDWRSNEDHNHIPLSRHTTSHRSFFVLRMSKVSFPGRICTIAGSRCVQSPYQCLKSMPRYMHGIHSSNRFSHLHSICHSLYYLHKNTICIKIEDGHYELSFRTQRSCSKRWQQHNHNQIIRRKLLSYMF